MTYDGHLGNQGSPSAPRQAPASAGLSRIDEDRLHLNAWTPGAALRRRGRAFITATATPVSAEARQDLRASLEDWLRAAYEAGLDDDAVTALIAVARRDLEKARERVE